MPLFWFSKMCIIEYTYTQMCIHIQLCSKENKGHFFTWVCKYFSLDIKYGFQFFLVCLTFFINESYSVLM